MSVQRKSDVPVYHCQPFSIETGSLGNGKLTIVARWLVRKCQEYSWLCPPAAVLGLQACIIIIQLHSFFRGCQGLKPVSSCLHRKYFNLLSHCPNSYSLILHASLAPENPRLCFRSVSDTRRECRKWQRQAQLGLLLGQPLSGTVPNFLPAGSQQTRW